MKYTILINQAAVVEAGLHKTTDLVDWAILEYIQTWQTNPEAERLDDFVWINYKHFIAEMPLVGLNTKGSVSRRLTKLEELSLIEKVLDEDGRAFCKTTVLFHQITQFKVKKSSKPTVHNGKHPVYDGKHPVYDGKQSTDNQKQIIKTNNNNNNNNNNARNDVKSVEEVLLSLDLKVKESELVSPTEEKAERQKEKVKVSFPILENLDLTESEKADANKKLAQLSPEQREIAIQAIKSANQIDSDMAYINGLYERGIKGELKPFKKRNNVTPASTPAPVQESLLAPISDENNAANDEQSRRETILEILKDKISRHKARMLEDFKKNRYIFVRGLGAVYQEDLAAAGLFD